MEFLAQQFYFRDPDPFAHVKIVLLLNPEGHDLSSPSSSIEGHRGEIVLRNELSENVTTFYCTWPFADYFSCYI